MDNIQLSLLRGICQTPAYVAHECGFFADEGINSSIKIEATAWLVPQRLATGESQFAVMPWTRAALADENEQKLVVVCGSGVDEAAIVVRKGLKAEDVKTASVPMRGGIKDLTAMALFKSLGWDDIDIIRQPSGDGSILSFLGEGVDAASMVEPYAAMIVNLGMGYVLKRTSDMWPGAPGCSFTVSAELRDSNPDLVQRAVRAFARAATFVSEQPKRTAEIAHRYIGVAPEHIESALKVNRPDIQAITHNDAMTAILDLMVGLGYLKKKPEAYCDLRFLESLGSKESLSQPARMNA